MKIRIMHSYYGCETGCCGHIVETEDKNQIGDFEFEHPADGATREQLLEWAKFF